MKRSSRPRATAELPKTLHEQLNMYAVAAGAAGVGLLALAQPAEAKIVYTRSHRVIGINQHFNLDLNHDGKTDFTVGDATRNSTSGGVNSLIALGASPNGVEGIVGTRGFFAAALRKGTVIPKGHFSNDGRMIFYCSGFLSCSRTSSRRGYWFNVANRYLGLKFKIDNQFHYGWARLSVQFVNRSDVTITLTGYAYETLAGKSIKAGQMKEAEDDPTNEDFSPNAFPTSPIPDDPHPATLGALALGAPGVSIWRGKESGGAGQ
jgi:hypothetical protein